MVTPNPFVAINSGVFSNAPTSVALTTTAFPIGGTLNSFTLLQGLSGIVTIGAGGNYTSLTALNGLFADINSKGLSENLTAIITDAVINETSAVGLAQIKYGCGDNYTITIRPQGGLHALLTGDFNGSLINLNGADNVVVDGINTGNTSLTIRNTNTGTGASTIRFGEDATNNTIIRCNIEGSSTSASSGTVIFATGTTTGNDNNTLSENNIRSAGTNLPFNALYSAGTSLLVDNSGNNIQNNNIHDYYNPAGNSNGVFIASNSSAWQISGNKFFQSEARTSSAAGIHRAINIVTASGFAYVINNNTIGFSNQSGTGTTTYNGSFNHRFIGIEVTAGINASSSLQGNTISGISIVNNSATANTGAPGLFSGISVLGGRINIGTTTGNIIGATKGIGAISASATITGNYIAGIYCTTSSLIEVRNNQIGSIAAGGANNIGFSFHGIHTIGTGQYVVTNNVIGSLTTNHSVSIGISGVTTTGVCTLNGINNASTGGLIVSENRIQNTSVYGTDVSVFNGILNSGVAAHISITNNQIIQVLNTGTTTGTTTLSGFIRGISNSAAATRLDITGNTIRGIVKPVTVGQVQGIFNSGAVLSEININGNSLGNNEGGFVNYTVASTATLTGISNTAGSANCALVIQNNNIQGIQHDVASSNAHNYIINSAATLSQNISNNSFTNISVNTTGAIILISNNVILPAYGVQNVNGNQIVGSFSRTAASGSLTLHTSTSSTGNTGVVVNNNNNNFSNITVSGAATILGWINTDAGAGVPRKRIQGNTFSNWTGGTGAITAMDINITSPDNLTSNNQINNIRSGGSITGILTAAGNDSIISNNIHTLISTGTTTNIFGISISTNGTTKRVGTNILNNIQANNITTGSVAGISIAGGLTNRIFGNKITAIISESSAISTGTVQGIIVSGTVADMTTQILNNKIGGLLVTKASATNALRGISIVNTGLRTSNIVSHNTVLLNAPASDGANFGSSTLFHTTNSTASTSNLLLLNNILVNTSAFKGTGQTVVYRRSSGTANMLGNFNLASNNNLYYAGIPGPNSLIYSDGTGTAQTLSTYLAGNFTAGIIAPRESASITELPDFISTVQTSSDYLKINPLKVTFIESGGSASAGIMLDFENEVRAGFPGYPAQTNGYGWAPDIGADEFDGIKPKVIVSGSNDSSNGNYANIKEAFTAINLHNQLLRNISVSVVESTMETDEAILSSGSWTTLNLFPSATGVTIRGNLPGKSLITLDGASNVTIDGRVQMTGSTPDLKIFNTSAAGNGTSSLKFTNSSNNNIIRYCHIQGSTTSSTEGVISFTGSSAGSGNSNNVIEFCTLTAHAGNRPVSLIYSQGSPGFNNSNNAVSNNRFFNFLNPTLSSSAINLQGHTTGWIINANSFYETNPFTPISGGIDYHAIKINNTAGNNFDITGNYMGGSDILCSGSPWVVDASTQHQFRAIRLSAGTASTSNIQNNIIRNWDYRSSSPTPWRAIQVDAGNIDIGTVTANIIGSNTGNGSVNLTSYTNAHSSAIYITSTGNIQVSKNNVGSISVSGNNSTTTHGFTAIYKSTGAGLTNISNNIIGSTTTAGSIILNSNGANSSIGQNLHAILSEGTGATLITNNYIANMANHYTGSEISVTSAIMITNGDGVVTRNSIYMITSASGVHPQTLLSGINLQNSSGENTVVENNVRDLSTAAAVNPGTIAGIVFNANTNENNVTRNFVRNLSVNASSTNGVIYGLKIESGNTTYSNNIISLSGNTSTTLFGIYETGAAGNNNQIYFNTVYLGGHPASGSTNQSFALYSNASNNNKDFRNNIFANARSTLNGSNLHYAIWLNFSNGANTLLDYNIYSAEGVAGVPGRFAGNNITQLPIIINQDEHSFLTNPIFVNPGGAVAGDYKQTAGFDGFFGLGIHVDFANTARGATPNIGAWEFNTNRWVGTVDTNFGNPANWSSGVVPLEDVPVVFALEPVNDCVLDIDRSVGSILNNQSGYKLVINGKKLTIKGDIYFTNGGIIDATTAGSIIVFAGEDEAQIIPESSFLNNIIPHLRINNVFGVISESDITIRDSLVLSTSNPRANQGSLHLPAKTITLEANATIITAGDITGTVKRNSFVKDVVYAFTNQYNTLLFTGTGSLPSEVRVHCTLGTSPLWKSENIQRHYNIMQTGAVSGDGLNTTITIPYLETELNSNIETQLAFFMHDTSVPITRELGRSTINTNQNQIQLSYLDLATFSNIPNQTHVGFGDAEIETITWNGLLGSSWTTPNNWTPSTIPSDYMNVVIPHAASTPNDPIIPQNNAIKRLKLEIGSVLNANTNSLLTVKGDANAWQNEGGTFNPSTSTVQFDGQAAVISGVNNFNHINISTGAVLNMANNSWMRIAGTVSLNGTWNPDFGSNSTVEYNGDNQNVVTPNINTNRYVNLVLSGSGNKMLPASALTILGDFTLSGTATALASNNLNIGGLFTSQSGTTFNTGSNSITMGGNLVQNGNLISTASTFILNGANTQHISGSAALTLNNLIIQNEAGVVSNKNLTVDGILDLQSTNPGATNGCLHLNNVVLSLGENAATTGIGEVSGTVSRSHLFNSNTAYTFGSSHTIIRFHSSGTLPDQVSIKTSPGVTPVWKNNAVSRIYDIVQNGGVDSYADITLGYLNSELNGNSAELLSYWQASGFPSPLTVEWGVTHADQLNFDLSLQHLPVDMLGVSPNQKLITFGDTNFPSLIWNGFQSNNWMNPFNWTPNRFPGKFSTVTIPDSGTTNFDPVLPVPVTDIFGVILQSNAILSSSNGSRLNVFGNNNASSNLGSFNALNSTVSFQGNNANIAGTTQFNNLNVEENAVLTPILGSVTQIAGTFLNAGTLHAATNPNTFVYNGANQNIVLPNGIPSGYHLLKIAQSGLKTLPAGNLWVNDDLSIENNAELNLSAALFVGKNIIAQPGTLLNSGNNTITLAGNLQTSGASLLTANTTLILQGTQPQTIDSISLQHLTINNPAGVFLAENTQINVTGTTIIQPNATLNIGTGRFVNANLIDNRNGTSGIYIYGSTATTPNGSLVFHNAQNNPVHGSVAMYSKAFRDENAPEGNQYKWQFFGIPIRTVVAEPTFYRSFVRSFVPNATGASSWQSLNNSSVLQSFNGYEITHNSPKTIYFEGILENRNFSQKLDFISGRRSAGQYIFANSLTAAIDIKQLNFDTHLDATVFIYNTGSSLDWQNQTGDDWSPGQYVIVPQNLAGIGSIPSIIPSMQGYMVRTIENPGANTLFTVPYSSTVKNTVRQRAKGNEQLNGHEPVYSILEVSGAKGFDKLWLFTEPTCTDGFDNGWDGTKMGGNINFPQLYAKTKAGNLQINTTNNIDETVLGFVTGADKQYTLTVTHYNSASVYDAIYLIDQLTNVSIDITQSGTKYQFNSNAKDNENRFKIVAIKKGYDNHHDNLVKIFFKNQQITIINPTNLNAKIWLFDLKGQLIRTEQIEKKSTKSVQNKMPAAVYLYNIMLENGQKITGKVLSE